MDSFNAKIISFVLLLLSGWFFKKAFQIHKKKKVRVFFPKIKGVSNRLRYGALMDIDGWPARGIYKLGIELGDIFAGFGSLFGAIWFYDFQWIFWLYIGLTLFIIGVVISDIANYYGFEHLKDHPEEM
jgi:hypothetical protein